MTERPTFDRMRAEAFKDPAFKAAYDKLRPAFERKRKLIIMRMAAGLTQAEMAEKLNTSCRNILRLENLNSAVVPPKSSVQEYARALGYPKEVASSQRHCSKE